MPRKIVAVAAWTFLCFLIYASVSPLDARPTLRVSTGLEHIAAFAPLGFLFCLAYPRRTALVLLLVVGSAALLELMQLATLDRHARAIDAVEKVVGGSIGWAVGRAILQFERAFRTLLPAGGRVEQTIALRIFSRNRRSRAPEIQTPSRRPEHPG